MPAKISDARLAKLEAQVAKLKEQRAQLSGTSETLNARLDAIIKQLPPWAVQKDKSLLLPKRYKVMHGGRGGGKSYVAADVLLVLAARQKMLVVCARELQNSIKDSVHSLLKSRIDVHGLGDFYTVQETKIIGANGSSFIFKGLRHNIDSIKSTHGIAVVWVEESQSVSRESWDILVPTIREPNSEIWVTFNPDLETDPVYEEFVAREDPNAFTWQVNWRDNPYFPNVLDLERTKLESRDPERYEHVWEGKPWGGGMAQVFKLPLIKAAARGEWQEPDPRRLYLMGVDPNGGGDDYFVSQVWDVTDSPFKLVSQERNHNRPTTYSLEKVTRQIDAYQPEILAIEKNGVGSIVAEAIAKIRPSLMIEEVITSQTSKRTMISRVQLLLEDGNVILPDDDELLDDFRFFRQSESKKLEAAAGHHDDCVMAMAIGMSALDTLGLADTGWIDLMR